MTLGVVLRVSAATCLLPALLAGQRGSGVVSGSVLADSTRIPIANALVTIEGLDRSTSTDEQGAFRFSGIRPGTYEMGVRRLGYVPYAERVILREGGNLSLEILLVRATVLDTVVTTAPAVIPSFEEHRAIGLGKFITRAELAKQEGRRLSEVIAQVQGVRIIPGKASNAAWLSSKRAQVTSISNRRTCGRGLDAEDRLRGAAACECYAQVYLDKHLVYRGTAIEGEPLFNLNSVPVDQIEAIEYYGGPSQTPLTYSRLNSNCGVLVIHTRRSP
jgi:hypothetical protein